MTNISQPTSITQSSRGFEILSEIAYREAGLVLSSSKSAMIESRLRHRLKSHGLVDLNEYSALLTSEEGKSERTHLISALTTNVTSFFREPHHFDFLRSNSLQALRKRVINGEQVRIWSAGCSSGQEAYSIAINLLEFSSDFASSNCKILATDIDTNILSCAREGVFNSEQVSDIDASLVKKYFVASRSPEEDKKYVAGESIRKLVTFKKLNLLENWPLHRKYQVIFCRNVVIYFDLVTQDKLWKKFYNVLSNDGLMFVGHSERISSNDFVSVGPTVYSKKS